MPGEDESGVDTWFPDGGATDEARVEDGPRYRDAVEVGVGSMGRVMGVVDSHLGRRVAYKELRRKVTSATTRARFLREARITAQLQHPGIAPVYDLGTDENGVPWYTMRFVEGQTLRDAIKAASTPAERLALLPHFVDACQAAGYAHAKAVVHRDLKPENILLGQFGETLVVDWGLAKAAGDDELVDSNASLDTLMGSDSTATTAGTVMGTPNWMSPEQARGEIHAIDARSDVWSLGVILYEILTGSRPFQGRTAEETLEKVRIGPVVEPRSVNSAVPTELSAVCLRALQRDPDARYPDAGALAADVEAFLSGGWVRAYEYSAWERAVRFLVRYRLLVGTAGFAALALAMVGAISFREVRDERDRAKDAEAQSRVHLAEAFAGKALTALEIGDLIQAELFAAGALALDERPDARGVLARTRATWRPTLAASFGPAAGCRQVHAWPDGTRAVCASRDGVSAWTLDPSPTEIWSVPDEAISATVSPDGTRVAVQSGVMFRMLDARDGRTLSEHDAKRRGASPRTVWRADGRRVAFARGALIHLLDPEGVLQNTVHVRGTVTDMAWLGDVLYASDLSGHVNRLTPDHLELDEATDPLVGNGLYSIAAHGDLVAVGTGSEGLFLLDADTLEVRHEITGHDGPVMGLAFSPDGHWLVSTGEDRTVRLIATASREQGFALALPEGTTGSLDFYDDDSLLVSAPGAPGQLWRVPTERPATTLGDHVAGLSAVAWHPDGQRLATATGPGRVDLYDRRSANPLIVQIPADNKVARDVVFGDPQTLISTTSTGKVDAWSLDGSPIAELHRGSLVLNLAVDLSRGHLYGTGGDGQMRRWESWGPPTEVWRGDSEQSLWEVVVSDDGSILAWVDGEDEITVVSLPDRAPIFHHRFERSPRATALSPDGSHIAWTTQEEGIELRSLPDGQVVGRLEGPENAIDDLEFSPDGSLLVASSWDQRVWLFDVRSMTLLALLADHEHRVVDAEFSQDGRWLATASWDGTARIWDMDALRADPQAILDELARDQGVQLDGARMVPVPAAPQR